MISNRRDSFAISFYCGKHRMSYLTSCTECTTKTIDGFREAFINPALKSMGLKVEKEIKESSMTFEEAWPEIKAGKYYQFRNKELLDNWSEWFTGTSRIAAHTLSYVSKCEFQIKREPREWTIQIWSDGQITDDRHGIPNKSPMELIKVREVLD